MNLDAVESFYWVAQLKSIAAAAGRLGVVRTAVSARIERLEEELGVVLLDRSQRRVRLTIAGARFLIYANKLLELQQQLKVELVSGTRQPVSLRLGVIESVLHGELVTWLAQLRREQPAFELELLVETTDVLQERLQRGALDLVLSAQAVMIDGVRTRPLTSLPLVLVGSRARHSRRHYTLAEVAEHDLITFQRGSQPHVRLLAQLRAAKLMTARVHTSSSIAAMVRLVASGFGIATLPRGALRHAPVGARLRALPCDTKLTPLPIHASFRTDPSSDAIEAILESAVRFLSIKRQERARSKNVAT